MFVHEGATFGATYKYHIVAEMASGLEILSNARSLEFSYPGAPSFTSLRRASVSDSGTVNIIVDLDPNSNDTHAYTLQRKRSSEAEFIDLETQNGVGGMTLTYTDYTAKTNESSYSYRVRVENFCSDSVGMSNTAETVWLRGISDFQLLKNTLHWTPYAEFRGYCRLPHLPQVQFGQRHELLTTLPSTVFTWEDDVSALLYSPGDFCYLIEATDALPGRPAASIMRFRTNCACSKNRWYGSRMPS